MVTSRTSSGRAKSPARATDKAAGKKKDAAAQPKTSYFASCRSFCTFFCALSVAAGMLQGLLKFEDDFYVLSNLPKNATKAQIGKAWRNHSKYFHPDKTHDLPEEERKKREEEFIRLQKSYEFLARSDKNRQEYLKFGEANTVACSEDATSDCIIPRSVQFVLLYATFVLCVVFFNYRLSITPSSIWWALTWFLPRSYRHFFFISMCALGIFEGVMYYGVDWDEGPWGGTAPWHRIVQARTVFAAALLVLYTYNACYGKLKIDYSHDEMVSIIADLRGRIVKLESASKND